MARQVPLLLAEEVAFGHAFLFVPVLVGAGAAIWFSLPVDPPVWPLLIAFILIAPAAVALRHGGGKLPPIVTGLVLLLAGMLLAELETSRLATVILDSPVTTDIIGRVERREVDADGRWRYLVRLDTTRRPELHRAPQRVSLLARARQDPVAVGDTVAGRVRLSPPSGPALPELNDFAFSSYFDGIGAVGFFYGAVRRLEPPPRPSGDHAATRLQGWLFDLRAAVGERIRRTVPGDPGAFAAAIVTDERRAISGETTDALRLAGLAHIVAISGLNMALAAGIFFIGVRTVLSLFSGFAQCYPIKKIAALGALLMVTAYYLISGFGVSAERAYIMMAVALVAVLFDRQSLSLRNIALSALIIIAMSPSEIVGPSFQMSFAATVALIAGYCAWQRHRQRKGGEEAAIFIRHRSVTALSTLGHFVAGTVMTSLIGGLSTAMFSVEHFHRITTYGLAANLAAMPLISFIVMPTGLIGMLLMPFGLDGPFLRLMGLGLQGVIGIAHYVASWGGDVDVGRQHPWFLPLATFGFILLTLLRTRLRLLGVPVILGAVLLSGHDAGTAKVPDLLVSEDGSLIGLRSGAGLAVNRSRPPDFIYDQWKRALLLGDPIKPEVSPGGDGPSAPEVRSGKAGVVTRPAEGGDLHRAADHPARDDHSAAAEPGGSTANDATFNELRSSQAKAGRTEPVEAGAVRAGEASSGAAEADTASSGEAEADAASSASVGTASVGTGTVGTGTVGAGTVGKGIVGAGTAREGGIRPTEKDLTRQEIEAARRAMQKAPVGRFRCRPRAWCAATSEQGIVVIAVEDGRYAGAACDAGGIVIAPRARFDRCRSGALMFNGETLRRTGALEITFPRTFARTGITGHGSATGSAPPSPLIATAADASPRLSAGAPGTASVSSWLVHSAMAGQNRPWTRHRFYNWRTERFSSDLPEPVAALVNGSGE